MADFRRLFYALALVALLAGLTIPASAQNPSFQCSVVNTVTPTIRSEGLTELVGDLVLSCTGGTPTLPGAVVPPVNIAISLNENITSRLLASATVGSWNEALLIIDEPHSGVNPTRPILNCGNTGALDTGGSGPNVCSITATWDPSHTYDGTGGSTGGTCSPAIVVTGVTCASQGSVFVPGASCSTYGCGRPNVFQGHTNPNLANQVQWLGVPLDPPGTTTTRTIRITNIRTEANKLGVGLGFVQNYIYEDISINGSTAISLSNSQVTVAYVQQGLYTTGGSSVPNFLQCIKQTGAATNGFTFQEGFGTSWKAKNISYIAGPGSNGIASGGYWVYDGSVVGLAAGGVGAFGTVTHPADQNQNVPGAIYNTESGFMYPAAGSVEASIPLDPASPGNPPNGTGTLQTATTAALSNGTLIQNAGIADNGTRLMFELQSTPTVSGATILVPEAIYLYNGSSSSSASGIAVLTTPADSNGSLGVGAYNPVYTGNSASTAVSTYTALTIPASGPAYAVYEVLWADPFSIESATLVPEVTYTPNLNLNTPTPGVTPQAFGGFAPTYAGNTNGGATAAMSAQGFTYAIPRFIDDPPVLVNLFSISKCACNLLFPYVTSASGYDTGLAIANTSTDNLGISGASLASAQSGTITFWYYGTQGSGGPPPSQTSASVPPGQVLTYVFSTGGGSIGLNPNGMIPEPSFTGYVIAQAQFQYCHAYAFITAAGAGPLSAAVSEGYLGLILDNASWNCNSVNTVKGLCRTTQSAENLVH